MDANLIPSVLMVALVLSHTVAIHFMKKKRETLDVTTPEGVAKSKQFGLIITMLYLEIPLMTAIIWLVIAPLLKQPN